MSDKIRIIAIAINFLLVAGCALVLFFRWRKSQQNILVRLDELKKLLDPKVESTKSHLTLVTNETKSATNNSGPDGK